MPTSREGNGAKGSSGKEPKPTKSLNQKDNWFPESATAMSGAKGEGMWGMDKVDDSQPQKRVRSECCLNRYNPAA